MRIQASELQHGQAADKCHQVTGVLLAYRCNPRSFDELPNRPPGSNFVTVFCLDKKDRYVVRGEGNYP